MASASSASWARVCPVALEPHEVDLQDLRVLGGPLIQRGVLQIFKAPDRVWSCDSGNGPMTISRDHYGGGHRAVPTDPGTGSAGCRNSRRMAAASSDSSRASTFCPSQWNSTELCCRCAPESESPAGPAPVPGVRPHGRRSPTLPHSPPQPFYAFRHACNPDRAAVRECLVNAESRIHGNVAVRERWCDRASCGGRAPRRRGAALWGGSQCTRSSDATTA